MFLRFLAIALILFALVGPVDAQGVENLPKPAPMAPDLNDEVRMFFRSGREAYGGIVESIQAIRNGIYFAGVKDGAMGTGAVALIVYLFLTRGQPPKAT